MRSKNPVYFDIIEQFINEYQEKNKVIPTNAEISKGTTLSTATVSRYIAQMKLDGRIEAAGHRNICTSKMKQSKEGTLLVAVLGSVACGLPKYAEENVEEYVRMPSSMLGNGEYYFLRAVGDSMQEIGIDEGDLVLIRQQDTANSGQIVVALVDDEATLKRFYPEPEKNRIRLHPENHKLEDIYVENCVVQGVAVKVIKDIL